ncbi:MAG: DNA replication/repair protein RecF [Pontibacterium sp.]
MTISRLHIQAVRNLNSVDFAPAARINILSGPNGSGKTSVLEAIHLLGLTRSFRTSKSRYLISTGETVATVFSQIDPLAQAKVQALGVERTVEGSARMRFAGSDIDLATLVELVPLQVIDSATFDILDGSPAIRRQFIDWGVFHADKAFIQLWRAFRRVLKQRNSLLKCGKIDHRMRAAWDHEFITFSEQLTRLRQEYLERLKPEFYRIAGRLLPGLSLELRFSAGWDTKRPLDEILSGGFERDLRQGFTGIGPQRADLKIKADGYAATERLSRGQKKLAVSALKLAQGSLFYQMTGRPCIYLIDDLPSELDSAHCHLFCQFIEEMASQCFITCVDPGSLAYQWQEQTDVAHFSINDGNITPL